MEIRIKSLKFDADKKLQDFIHKKVSKIERFDDSLTEVEVTLSLLEKPDNKSVKLQAFGSGNSLFVERTSNTFEDALNDAVDVMKEKIVRNKEKHGIN